MTIPLKEREIRCLAYLRDKIGETGVSPTLREIGTAMGFKSPPNAHWILKSLQEKGYIRKVAGRHRAIEIVPQGKVVTLQPDTHFLAATYANKHGIPLEQVANDLLRDALKATATEAR